jgi:hypothetical protein
MVALSALKHTFAVALDFSHRHCLCAWGATGPLFAQVVQSRYEHGVLGAGLSPPHGDRPTIIVLVVNGQPFASAMRSVIIV